MPFLSADSSQAGEFLYPKACFPNLLSGSNGKNDINFKQLPQHSPSTSFNIKLTEDPEQNYC
jgi:hypothetical protein